VQAVPLTVLSHLPDIKAAPIKMTANQELQIENSTATATTCARSIAEITSGILYKNMGVAHPSWKFATISVFRIAELR